MATLFGTKIKDTYEGVLKLIDNLGLTASPKEITDGAGAGSGVFVANDGSLKASDIHSTASIQNDGGYKDSTGALGTANQILSTTGAVTTWVDAAGGGGVEGGLQTDDGLALGATNKSITDSLANATGFKLGTGATVEVTKRVSQTGLGGSTFFGKDAGLSDDGTNNKNTSFGSEAMKNSTTGIQNAAVGNHAMLNNTTGRDNASFGGLALRYGSIGSYNTSVGSQSGMYANTNSCIYIGYKAGYWNARANTLYIATSDTATPLIYGEFDNNRLIFNVDSLNFSNIPTSSVGLVAGDVWRSGNDLKIV